MPNYKEMYLHLMRETEKACRILIKAQQDCEELYPSAPEPELTVLEPSPAGGTPFGDLLSACTESRQRHT